MTSQVTLKALGLNTSPNQLNLEDGSLRKAKNVIIRRDNVIEPRRGFKLWAESMGTSSDRAKQLFVYKDRILRHYASTLQFQNGTNNDGSVNFDTFEGSFSEVDTGLRIKGIEANSNFYFTTSEGVKKISAKTANDLSTSSDYIVNSGVPKALDIEAFLDVDLSSSSGFLPVDSAVAYRVVWGYRDLNENLLLGAPSEREELYSFILTFIQADLNNLLAALDKVGSDASTNLISNNDYLSTLGVTSSTSADAVRTNSIALAQKIDEDIQFVYMPEIVSVVRAANVVTITFTGGDANNFAAIGDTIQLVGFSASAGASFDGNRVVTNVTPTTIQFAQTATNATNTTVGFIFNSTQQDWVALFLVDTVASSSDVVTITFENNGQLVEDYFSIGDFIYLNGYGTIGGTSINGKQEITTVDNTTRTITFTVAGTGTNSTTTFGSIVYGNYREITQPVTLSLVPTNAQLASIQTYLLNIMDELKAEKNTILQSATKTLYINSLNTTTATNVTLKITIPEQITTNYFYQVYRSPTVTATGTDVLTDLVPSDELQQVFEGFPTQAEIDAGTLQFTDITPDAFLGANLYTNANSGSGILQANDPPPLCKDIELFKGYTFFANTKTRHQLALDMLGVTNVKGGAIVSISAGVNASIVTVSAHGLQNDDFVFIQGTDSDLVNGLHQVTVTGSTSFTIGVSGVGAGNKGSWSGSILNITNEAGNTNMYSFVEARTQQTTITCPTFVQVTNGEYITINSTNNNRKYYAWFDKDGTAVDPALDGYTGIYVRVIGLSTAAQISERLYESLAPYSYDFTVTKPGATTVRVTNVEAGFADPIALQLGSLFSLSFDVIGIGQQLQQLTQRITTVADVAGSLAGDAVLMYAPFNRKSYYFWFRVSGSGSDPAITGASGFPVDIATNATNAQVATALSTAINTNISDEITASVSTNNVTIESVGFGDADYAENYSLASPGFSYTVIQNGTLVVEKSAEVSPSIATDETARNLINAINLNKSEIIYAYYLSGADDIAGKMFFESRTLDNAETPFYINTNSSTFGAVFNPDISPETLIGNVSDVSGTTNIAIGLSHGYIIGDEILLTNTTCVPSIDGSHTVIATTANSVRIAKRITTSGIGGFITLAKNAEFSSNEERPNRVYYSKFQQPEAVPVLNFIDVGAKDEQILRILTLRDSLFVFKQDGLFRISGESEPFSTSLFDGSCVLLAPDSLAILENIVFGWARSGIVQVTESGVMTISRPIDNVILPTASSGYVNFKTATFGIGYESDQSYTVWTVSDKADDVATIAYRYHTLTRTWTTYDKTNTCGIVSPVDDLIYLGAGDTNFLEQERKNYERTDYADRETASVITPGLYNKTNQTLRLASVSGISVGDVITQEQLLTIYEYNALLEKLDLDSGPSSGNFLTVLEAFAGDNLRNKIISLAQYLDLDANVFFTDYESTIASKSGSVSNSTGMTTGNPTVITSTAHGLISGRIISISGSDSNPSLNGTHEVTVIDANSFSIPVSVLNVGTSGNFSWVTSDNDYRDIKACYNEIIRKLNLDPGINYSNYSDIDTETTMESIITAINIQTRTLTLSNGIDYIAGPITIYQAIDTEFEYTPITMQDPLGWKHLREATVMFENRAFTSATLSFATDLLPEFIEIPFNSDGNGTFGFTGFGSGFFGGASNAAPFRTYVPRQCQRCRFMLINYKHKIGRELFSIYGMTLTGNISQSSKAYRS